MSTPREQSSTDNQELATPLTTPLGEGTLESALFEASEASTEPRSPLPCPEVVDLDLHHIDADSLDPEDRDCTICYEAYSSEDVPTKLPGCGHVFGTKCLKRWIRSGRDHNRCPTCRHVLFSVTEPQTEQRDEVHLRSALTDLFDAVQPAPVARPPIHEDDEWVDAAEKVIVHSQSMELSSMSIVMMARNMAIIAGRGHDDVSFSANAELALEAVRAALLLLDGIVLPVNELFNRLCAAGCHCVRHEVALRRGGVLRRGWGRLTQKLRIERARTEELEEWVELVVRRMINWQRVRSRQV